jgi:DNA-binding response OmpR family regulator
MEAMNEEGVRDTDRLRPQYQTYERQKCFIAYTEQAGWSDDLLSACQGVLSRPEFNLEPDYARKHFHPDIPLRQKALELIANARYGIYDFSYWRDEKGMWHMPCNIFIELGMAIAFNRPTLLLRHASNRELELPECLQSIRGHILEFSGQTTLKRVLEKRLPQWVNAPPERDWWNRFCIFGGRVCEYREAHPRTRQRGQKILRCHISDGPDLDQPDFRGVVEEVLERFSDVTYTYLSALPIAKGYDFLLCTHCQTVRSTPFAIYRITPQTSAETFIAIGMSIALETQFEYSIPKMLLTERVQNIPSLLSGYEVAIARSYKERKFHLRTFLPVLMHKVREATWKPRPLPFIQVAIVETRDQDIGRARDQGRLLVVKHDPDNAEALRIYFEHHGYEVVVTHQGTEGLRLAKQRVADLIILDVILPDLDGYEVLDILRSDPQTCNMPVLLLTTRDERSDRITGLELGAEDYVTEPLHPIYGLDLLRLRIQNRIRFAREHPTMARSHTGGRILIVEDDRDISSMLRLYFDSQGYKVLTVTDGNSTLEACLRQLPDIVMLNVGLPDIDGYEVCRRLRSNSRSSHIPILFLTQRDEPGDIITALELGAEDYILKPFDIEELKWRVFNLIARSHTKLIADAEAQILIADDDPDIRSLIRLIVSNEGYSSVKEASSSHEVLTLLESEPYDLMTLDSKLPGMDWREVVHRAHNLHPKLSVILIGYRAMDAEIATAKAEIVDYLTKPFAAEELADSVKRALQ